MSWLILEKKSATYARNGILKYWVIDLVNKQLIVHTQPKTNSYGQIKTMTKGKISPQAFSNLEIAINRMLLF